MFKDKKNYLANSSCAIHVHFQPNKKLNHHDIRMKVADVVLMRKAEKYAFEKLCSELKRRKNNDYCRRYSALKTLPLRIKHWRTDKYRFIRQHPQGTLEARFFSVCKHKVENVIKFFNFYLPLLLKTPSEFKKSFILPKPKIIIENISHKLKIENPTQKIHLELGKIKEII